MMFLSMGTNRVGLSSFSFLWLFYGGGINKQKPHTEWLDSMRGFLGFSRWSRVSFWLSLLFYRRGHRVHR